jgi:hypothetical protein
VDAISRNDEFIGLCPRNARQRMGKSIFKGIEINILEADNE